MIRVEKGNGPLILCLPHAGSDIPPAIAPRLSATGRLQTDVSWRLEKVLDLSAELDATIIRSTISPYVVDPDQDPSGFRDTRTVDGVLCPLETLDGKPIYKHDEHPGPAEIEQRLLLFHSPFHDALCREIERLSRLHEKLVLLDCRSIRSRIKGFCDRGLPIISLGTADGTSCDPELKSLLSGTLAEMSGYSVGVDDVFHGGFLTRSYGRPGAGLHAMTLVVAQRAYLRHESPPFEPDKLRVGRLRATLRDAFLRVGEWAAPGYAESRKPALSPEPAFLSGDFNAASRASSAAGAQAAGAASGPGFDLSSRPARLEDFVPDIRPDDGDGRETPEQDKFEPPALVAE